MGNRLAMSDGYHNLLNPKFKMKQTRVIYKLHALSPCITTTRRKPAVGSMLDIPYDNPKLVSSQLAQF